MTLSPLILLLLGVLAYRTYKGKGPLAEMLRGLTGAAPDAASAPPEGYPQRGAPPVPPGRPMGAPMGRPMAPPAAGMRGPFGGNMGAFAGGMAGGLIGSGLNELLHRFQHNGYGDVANSWIGTGPNRAIAPDDLRDALGSDTVNALAEQAGLSDIDALSGLSRDLPGAVDELTPTGAILDDYADFGGDSGEA